MIPVDDKLLTAPEVADRYSVHMKSLARLVKEGRIPPPLEGWTGQKHRWLLSEVVAHMRSMRQRQQEEART